MITVETIEKLHVIADTVLRKHDGNIERALPEFIQAAVNAGLMQDPENLMPFRVSIEFAAQQYLEAYAKEMTP